MYTFVNDRIFKTYALEYDIANKTRLRTFRAGILKLINDNS